MTDEKLFWIFVEVDEIINHFFESTASAATKRDCLHLATKTFYILHARDEVAVAGSEYDRVHFMGHLDSVYRHPDIPVGFLGATVKYLQVLGFDFDTDFLKRFEERLLFAAFSIHYIGDGANKFPITKGGFEYIGEVDFGFV